MPKSGHARAFLVPVRTSRVWSIWTRLRPVRLPTACDPPDFCMSDVVLTYSNCPVAIGAIPMLAGAETHQLAYFGMFHQLLPVSRDSTIEILRRCYGSSILMWYKRGPTLGTILCRHFEYRPFSCGPFQSRSVYKRPVSRSRARRLALRPRQPLSRAERAQPRSVPLGRSDRSAARPALAVPQPSRAPCRRPPPKSSMFHRPGRALLPPRAARERRCRSTRRAALDGRVLLREIEARARMSRADLAGRQRERVERTCAVDAHTFDLEGVERREASRAAAV